MQLNENTQPTLFIIYVLLLGILFVNLPVGIFFLFLAAIFLYKKLSGG